MPRDPYVDAYDRDALADEAQYLRAWSDVDLWDAAAPMEDPLTQEGFDCAVARFELQRRERRARDLERETEQSRRAFEESNARLEAGFRAVADRERERRRFKADQERRRRVAVQAQADQAREEHWDMIHKMFGVS